MNAFQNEIEDEIKFKIGKEMKHSATAFVSGGWSRATSLNSNENSNWAVRWMTPDAEVPLCGHGTLASAHVIFNKILRHREIYENETSISFESKVKGKLGATMNWSTGIITLDFPSSPSLPFNKSENNWIGELMEKTLGPSIPVISVDDIQFSDKMKILVLRIKVPDAVDPEAYLRKVTPDTEAMYKIVPEKLEFFGVCVTVQGNGVGPHFYSRIFQPWIGLVEDPTCGSLHTVLAPYWSKVLGQEGRTLHARMASVRTGDLFVTLLGDRVHIGGRSRMVVEGEIFI